MQHLIEALPVLAVPLVACVVIASLHCYMGLHVIRRGVIFVDLALAQCAALGAAVALFLSPAIWPESLEAAKGIVAVTPESEAALADQLLEEEAPAAGRDSGADAPGRHAHHHAHDDCGDHAHHGEQDRFGYGMSLVFSLMGAVLLSVGRFRDERVPHEAIIGIIFVVAAAVSVLILSKSPHGHEEMEAMLIGSILFVSWSQVGSMALLYLVIGGVHIAIRKRLIAITEDVGAADKAGIHVKLWDCLFYGTFALMVTQSVRVGGVLVVFSYLIIPAACSLLFARGFGVQLVLAWVIALAATAAGLVLSAVGDMPTGSSLVTCFGAALILCVLIRKAIPRPSTGGEMT